MVERSTGTQTTVQTVIGTRAIGRMLSPAKCKLFGLRKTCLTSRLWCKRRLLSLLAVFSICLTAHVPPVATAQERGTSAASTATVVPDVLNAATRTAIDEGLAWLAERQQADGSFGSQRDFSQRVGVTALCGLAFLSAGSVPEAGPYATQVNRCIDYLSACSKSNGYLVDSTTETHGPMYGHGFATMFLAEVYGMTPREELRDQLKRAVDLILATQNAQGGWRYHPVPEDADISVTVCQVMALRAARNAGIAVPKEVIDRAVEYIRNCQNPDGGFRYRLFDPAESKVARSAAAVVALYTAGVTDDPAVRRGLNYLEQERQRDRDREYYYYTQYYAVQAYWHAGDDIWLAAFPSMRDAMLHKREQRHWRDATIGDEFATAMVLIALQIPRNLVPIFER